VSSLYYIPDKLSRTSPGFGCNIPDFSAVIVQLNPGKGLKTNKRIRDLVQVTVRADHSIRLIIGGRLIAPTSALQILSTPSLVIRLDRESLMVLHPSIASMVLSMFRRVTWGATG